MTGDSLNGTRKVGKAYERIIKHIRGEISSRKLRPGDKLPPETDLARSLGVSRPTVREALKVLESQNVLRSSTGPTGGTFVEAIDGAGVAEYLTDSISLLLDVDELTLEELWDAREVTDVPAAELAAARRTEQDIFVIEKTVEMDELKEGVAIVSDISFHRAVAEASKNRMLSLFAGSIHMTLRTLAERYVIPENILPEVKRISQQQHRLVCEAISDRDGATAAARMREHLELSYGVYEQAMPREYSGSIGGQPPAEGNRPDTGRSGPRPR
ncbi:MAG: FadR family transcriptional regulator [Rubrobacter sp.]|jgi:DNA-binding FadR family transcriptional regulator|nr:FadR family transcriptional regulator [Rubrobacter sp.]MDQ3360490.1 FadR family transcriptional regulator [Actinomycetota bacterium]